MQLTLWINSLTMLYSLLTGEIGDSPSRSFVKAL